MSQSQNLAQEKPSDRKRQRRKEIACLQRKAAGRFQPQCARPKNLKLALKSVGAFIIDYLVPEMDSTELPESELLRVVNRRRVAFPAPNAPRSRPIVD